MSPAVVSASEWCTMSPAERLAIRDRSMACLASSRPPVTPRTKPIVNWARASTASAPTGWATSIARRAWAMAPSRSRAHVSAHAIAARAAPSRGASPAAWASARALGRFAGALEVADDEVERALGLMDLMDGHDALGAAGQMGGGLERLVVERQGVARRERLRRRLRGAHEVDECALPVLGRHVVSGQDAGDLRHALAVERLERARDSLVQRAALRGGNRGVGHVVGERVLEGVGHLG